MSQTAILAKNDAQLRTASAYSGQGTYFDTSGNIVNNPVWGFKNKIIGGDFTTNPWQRGVSFTGLGTSAATYVADRFSYVRDSEAVVTITKTADAPLYENLPLAINCLHVDVTTVDASIAAAQYSFLMYRVEGVDAASFGFGQSGVRYVTLSFWVKSTKTGIFCVNIQNNAQNRNYVAEYTVSVTNTWEKKIVTILVDTQATWLYDTGVGISIRWTLACGSNLNTATANTWQTSNLLATANQVNALDNVANDFKIALVQLEAGSVATPFETRSAGQELNLCQRYYEFGQIRFYSPASGVAYTGVLCQYQVNKRAIPTLTVDDSAGTPGKISIVSSAIGAATNNVAYFSNLSGTYGHNILYVAGGTSYGIIYNWFASAEL